MHRLANNWEVPNGTQTLPDTHTCHHFATSATNNFLQLTNKVNVLSLDFQLPASKAQSSSYFL